MSSLSRIKSDKVNLSPSIVVDFTQIEQQNALEIEEKPDELLIKRENILEKARLEGEKIIELAKEKAAQIEAQANIDIESAKEKANIIIENANKEAETISKNSVDEIETLKQNAIEEGQKQGFDEGFKQGFDEIQEKLKNKFYQMDDIAQNINLAREKFLNSSKAEIVNLVLLIAKKVCINSVDKNAVFNAVSFALNLLSDKEQIKITLSKSYADMLNELLSEQNPDEENKINIDKLQNIKIDYDFDLPLDTILLENPKERLDASFSSQLDVIMREFNKIAFDEKSDTENDENNDTMGA